MTEVPAEVVARNRRVLRHLGFGRVPVDLGDGPPGPVRPPGEVLDRALALHVVVSVAGGLDGGAGRRWLAALGAEQALHPGEADYLADAADGIRVEDAARTTDVEALAVLLWALGLLDDLSLEDPAAPAAGVLPAPGDRVDIGDPAVRPEEELREAHDLLAGMAWALRADPDLEVGAAPGSLDPYVVRRRLAAVDWTLGRPWT